MKINNLIIFGGNRDKENGPVTPLIQSVLKKKIPVVLFTDNIHLKMRDSQNIEFREKLKNYEKKGLKITKLLINNSFYPTITSTVF